VGYTDLLRRTLKEFGKIGFYEELMRPILESTIVTLEDDLLTWEHEELLTATLIQRDSRQSGEAEQLAIKFIKP